MPKPRLLPPRDYLFTLFAYDPETGVLTWRNRPVEHFFGATGKTPRHVMNVWNARYAGKPAGCLMLAKKPPKKPYYTLAVRVDGVLYLVSRIIYKMWFDEEPTQIDHRDTSSLNNKINNLRPCDNSENGCNKSKMPTNKTGFKGVSVDLASQLFVAQIKKNKRNKYLGLFHTARDAHAAYCKAARGLHGQFAKTD